MDPEDIEARRAALDDLLAEMSGCVSCELRAGCTRVVPGGGPPHSSSVWVGEAPGGTEDLTGTAFSGPAGGLLARMIVSTGTRREHVHVRNVLGCRPPRDRRPLPSEVEVCTSRWLLPVLEVLRSKVLVALGSTASRFFTGLSVSEARGRVHDFHGIRVHPVFHPAHFLWLETRDPRRAEEHRALTRLDLEVVRRDLEVQGEPEQGIAWPGLRDGAKYGGISKSGSNRDRLPHGLDPRTDDEPHRADQRRLR